MLKAHHMGYIKGSFQTNIFSPDHYDDEFLPVLPVKHAAGRHYSAFLDCVTLMVNSPG